MGAVLVASLFMVYAFAISAAVSAPAGADERASVAPVLADNFTKDSTLNTALWQINGTVAQNFSQHNAVAPINITLAPTFSSAGMEIAQATASGELGAIQSVESFSPPFTVTAVVEGLESNGHPFIFGIANHNATYGYQVTGNLNPSDCSHESNCGDPATCGTPHDGSIPAGQCYYGIYGRYGVGKSSGTWSKGGMLNYSPGVDIVYTIEIQMDPKGGGQVTLLDGAVVLGQQSGQLGSTGPYYLIVAQGEGSPVPGPGANIAVWKSINVTPTSTYSGPPPSVAGTSNWSWMIALLFVAIAAVLAFVVVGRRRRRGFTVRVLDSEALSAVTGAGVTAVGPSRLTGDTGTDGRISFGHVPAGTYTVTASASGYTPSDPLTVRVETVADQTVRLRRAPQAPQMSPRTSELAAGPAAAPTPPVVVPAAPPTPPRPPPEPGAAPRAVPLGEEEDAEGRFGGRIAEIVRTFQARGALSPETALTAEELGLSRLFVRVMKRRRGRTRVFVEVNGKYYLDEKALQEMM